MIPDSGAWTSHRVVRTAIALACSVCGVAATHVLFVLTGEFVTAVLVVPVLFAAWYGGAASGGLTIAMQAIGAAVLLEPAYSLRVAAEDDLVRLAVVTAVSAGAMWMVIRARRLERHFKTVVDIALEGLWVVDAEGRTRFVNPRMAEMLGYLPSEMRRRRFTEFVPRETVAGLETVFRRLRHGIKDWKDVQLLHRDGSVVWAHYAATPMWDGGAFDGALAVVTDISQRKSDETALRSQAEALQRADVEKDQFLAMLAHELRNPLGPIVTALRLMDLKGDISFERERTIIGRQAAVLSRLVEDLSDVSRFMRGSIAMQRGPVDIAQVIDQARETVTALLSRKAHSFEVGAHGVLTVQGDAGRLVQVVVNLLTNAAKYTPAGGHIRLDAAREGDSIVIRVRDNGLGISPDFLPRLFEPFTQKAQTRAYSEGGLGLGLAIVHAIVTAHGGTIAAYSDGEGCGSEFVVRLPVHPAAAVSVAEVDARANEHSAAVSSARS